MQDELVTVLLTPVMLNVLLFAAEEQALYLRVVNEQGDSEPDDPMIIETLEATAHYLQSVIANELVEVNE
jgi:hypothetical protein